ncbi:acyl--CoA ligase, partial [Staphylococcus epidermidis]
SEMLRTKDLQYRITHGEIDAVIAMHSLTKEFEGVKEYEQLTKFIVAGHQQGWISIDDEKAEASDMLETADTSRDDLA